MISTYPGIVPTLEDDEVCIGPYKKNDGCGCLVYWQNKVFLNRLKGASFNEQAQVSRRVRQALVKELGFHLTDSDDEGFVTPRQVAAGWNRAMRRRLGYTVPCEREDA